MNQIVSLIRWLSSPDTRIIRIIFSCTASVGILAFLGYIDAVTGAELSISLFYLAPILIVVWSIGAAAGVVLSVVCVLVIIFTNRYSPTGDEVLNITYLWNHLATLGFYLIAVFALWLLKKSISRERLLATTDPVTGLSNSRHFQGETEREIDRSRRYGHPLSMMFIDCDNFKKINDTFGHHTGDILIRAIGDELSRSVRSTDLVSRLGGDEFAILLPETEARVSRKHFNLLNDRLRRRMNKNKWNVTFSIGVATFIRPPKSADEMIKRADSLMYKVKRSGKNGVIHKVFH